MRALAVFIRPYLPDRCLIESAALKAGLYHYIDKKNQGDLKYILFLFAGPSLLYGIQPL